MVTAELSGRYCRVIGYSTQSVNGEDLITARDPNPINGLIGKVAGLQIGATSEILGVPNVTIRGNTVSLYVVDGLPINSDTFDLSPDDIETYTVLKGPAAAALYGSRAQFGAIVITTKKGEKNKKGISVDINSSTVLNSGFVAFLVFKIRLDQEKILFMNLLTDVVVHQAVLIAIMMFGDPILQDN